MHKEFDLVAHALKTLDEKSDALHEKHLIECVACREEYAHVLNVLSVIDNQAAIEPSSMRVDNVLKRIAGDKSSPNRWAEIFRGPKLVFGFASLCAVILIVGAFLLFKGHVGNDPMLYLASYSGEISIRDLETGDVLEDMSSKPFSKIQIRTNSSGQANFEVKMNGKTESVLSLSSGSAATLFLESDKRSIELDKGYCLLTLVENPQVNYKISCYDSTAIVDSKSVVEIGVKDVLSLPVFLRRRGVNTATRWSFTDISLKELAVKIEPILMCKFEFPSERIAKVKVDFYSDSTDQKKLFHEFVKKLEHHNLTVIQKSEDVYTINAIYRKLDEMVDKRLMVRVYKGGAMLKRRGIAARVNERYGLAIDRDSQIHKEQLEDGDVASSQVESVKKDDSAISGVMAPLRRNVNPRIVSYGLDRYFLELNLEESLAANLNTQLDAESIKQAIGRDDIIIPILQ
ncbi:MAG: hypothetical protein HY606_11440 [Planctomycetes bacterium]|nr:hypothetical protein [Planctomycetota bacterium]